MQNPRTAAQINEEKEKIISLLLHDLRPPLQVLRFLTGHLSGSSAQGMSPEMIQGYMQELNMAVEELVQSSAAIFTWLEVQRDRFIQPAQPTDVDSLLQQAMQQFNQEVPNQQVQFTLPATTGIKAVIDSNAVGVILHQLLRNAAAAKRDGIITLKARKDNEVLYLSVHDQGKGLSRQVVENIEAQMMGNDNNSVLYRYGYRIIIRVLQLLEGSIHFDTSNGTTVTLAIGSAA